MDLEQRTPRVRFLIHDRDSKFSGPFDDVFRSEDARVILTPIRAPNANAFAERWVRTIRAECLDWTLILVRRHLDHVLSNYVEHYNRQRPSCACPRCAAAADPRSDLVDPHEVRPRDVLGGLIHEYEAAAA